MNALPFRIVAQLKNIFQLIVRVLLYVLPVVVFLSVWRPVILPYYIAQTDISNKILQLGRTSPTDPVLDELASFGMLMDISWQNENQLIAAAEGLLQGEVRFPGHSETKIEMPFKASDISRGQSHWQLTFASFAIPRVLLKAYSINNDERFLQAAQNFILDWADYELTAWLPNGFLWNDHAIAARAVVLAQFWRVYRTHDDYDPKVAKVIFHLAEHSVKMLAAPQHFTYATNHGVMQNLALWHLTIAFPTLPETDQYQKLAFDRLADQMIYYINREGVVLEHSFGYHQAGVEFLGMALRYLALLNLSPPNEWLKKYENAKKVYAGLRRPDGSIPKIGDTLGKVGNRGPRILINGELGYSTKLDFFNEWHPTESYSAYPVAGYTYWWSGLENWPNPNKLSQTVITWSNYLGHGHKHADELSFELWARGQSWLTNVGYWPYDVSGRLQAVSWGGSNAPHLAGEDSRSTRTSSLAYTGSNSVLSFIDLIRKGPGTFTVRRQIVNVKPHIWVTIDRISGNDIGTARTVWTPAHDLVLEKGSTQGSYVLRSQDLNLIMNVFLLSSQEISIQRIIGNKNPHEGWEVVNGLPKPTPALVVEQPAKDSWSVMVWILKEANDSIEISTIAPKIINLDTPTQWEILIPVGQGTYYLKRENEQITTSSNNLNDILRLTESASINKQVSEINSGYEEAAENYPKIQNFLIKYRIKATYLLIALLISQAFVFIVMRKYFSQYSEHLAVFSVVGWLVMSIWLNFVYLST